jgi:hypothetical protein
MPSRAEKSLVVGLFAVWVPGCAAYDNSMLSNFPEDTIFENPTTRKERLVAVDDAKCRELGFSRGTDAYGNCRLQLEQIRAANRAASASQDAAAAERVRRPSTSDGGASLLCKDAISRNDQGGIMVHC